MPHFVIPKTSEQVWSEDRERENERKKEGKGITGNERENEIFILWWKRLAVL